MYEPNQRYHNHQNFVVFPEVLKAHSTSASVYLRKGQQLKTNKQKPSKAQAEHCPLIKAAC